MNVFFDVDGTLIAGSDARLLRPFAETVLATVASDGHHVYVWSGVGLRWDEIARHGLMRHVTNCFLKPLANHRDSLGQLGVTVEPHFVVDDHSDVVSAFGGYRVRTYASLDPDDRDLLDALAAIRAFTAQQVSSR